MGGVLKNKSFYCKIFPNVRIRNYVAILTFKMPFSIDNTVVIKHYRLDEHYRFKRLLKEIPNKGWKKRGLRYLLRKIDKTWDFARIPGSSRNLTPTVLTNENVEKVVELILRQEQNTATHESQRNIGRIIGISQSSASRIYRQSLGLTAFHKTKVQELSDAATISSSCCNHNNFIIFFNLIINWLIIKISAIN